MGNFDLELEFQKNNAIRSIISHLRNYQETNDSKFLIFAAEWFRELVEIDKLFKGVSSNEKESTSSVNG